MLVQEQLIQAQKNHVDSHPKGRPRKSTALLRVYGQKGAASHVETEGESLRETDCRDGGTKRKLRQDKKSESGIRFSVTLTENFNFSYSHCFP